MYSPAAEQVPDGNSQSFNLMKQRNYLLQNFCCTSPFLGCAKPDARLVMDKKSARSSVLFTGDREQFGSACSSLSPLTTGLGRNWKEPLTCSFGWAGTLVHRSFLMPWHSACLSKPPLHHPPFRASPLQRARSYTCTASTTAAKCAQQVDTDTCPNLIPVPKTELIIFVLWVLWWHSALSDASGWYMWNRQGLYNICCERDGLDRQFHTANSSQIQSCPAQLISLTFY